MMLPVETPQPITVVEGEDLDNRPAAGTRTLLFAALLCSLPIYLVILFLSGDPILSGHGVAGRSGTPQQAAPKLVVKGIAGMDFSPLQTAPIKSKEELVKAMICTFEPRSGAIPDRVYLRIDSFERFSETAMDSGFNRMPARDWPDFAFADVVGRSPGETSITADLQFFCNFEERLPHPSPLRSLTGPLDFCSMRDGSIVLEKTVAVGDEFVVESGEMQMLLPADELAEVDVDSPYLALGFLDSSDLRVKAKEISQGSVAGPQTVFKIVGYLEKNGLYKKDYRQTTGMHPVKEFLLKSMTGYCQHFAAALVLLCRMNSIPARVAGGFVSSKRNGKCFVIVETMAHAWAEVLTKKGWKIVDVSPQRSDSPPPLDQGVSLPSSVEFASINKQLKKENARKHSSGSADKGGAQADESAESADSAGADENAEDAEPPRRPQNITRNGAFENAKSPATIAEDHAREERQKKLAAEKKRKIEEKERRETLKKSIKALVALLLLVAIIWFIMKNAEKWLKWLTKLLKKRGAQRQDQPETAEEESLRATLVRMSNMNDFELQGKDVIILFNHFSQFMETRGLLPRQEHETPGEYFDRLCVELNLRPADGKIAAQCFEAELYGGQHSTAAATKKFLQFLQQILNKIS